MSTPHVRVLTASASLLLVAAGAFSAASLTYPPPAEAQAVPGQAHPQAVVPEWTPFEKNPSVFGSPQEAIRALDSPDILMRRSGVEWLGRWTYTAYGMSTDQKHFKEFDSQPELVTDLTRAVREMPKEDSQQAARLLVLLGPSAKPAIPAVCAALASPDYGNGKPQDSDDFVARAGLLNSLTHLCGGIDGVAPTLAALMQNREPETRRAAAAAVRFCADPMTRNRGDAPEGAYPWMPPEKQQQWHVEFHKQTMPALAVCVDDSVTVVRLVALSSLERLTYDSADAPWQAVEPALAHAVASTNPAVRLAALKVLAYMPADVSPLVASLRSGLHRSQEERNYALAALSHAAQTDRAAAVNAFLLDLASSDLLKRRQAAYDVQLVAIPLAAGNFWPGPYPLENWWNDSRLFVIYDPLGLTQSQKETLAKQRQAAAEVAQPILLMALAKSASDSDHAVRASAASSLEQIGNWTYRLLGFGGIPNPAWTVRPQVEKALAQAVVSLQPTEPILAGRLQELHDKIVRGPSAVY